MNSDGTVLLFLTVVPGLLVTLGLMGALVARGPSRRRARLEVVSGSGEDGADVVDLSDGTTAGRADLREVVDAASLDGLAEAATAAVAHLAERLAAHERVPAGLFVAVEATASVGLDEGPTLDEALTGTLNHPPGQGEVGRAATAIADALRDADASRGLRDVVEEAAHILRDRPHGQHSGVVARALVAGMGAVLGLPEGVPLVLSPSLADEAARTDPRAWADDQAPARLLRAVEDGARRMAEAVDRIDGVVDRWSSELPANAGRARELVGIVGTHPMITVSEVCHRLRISPRTARHHLRRLADRGWLVDGGVHGPNQRKQWLAPEVIDAVLVAFGRSVDLRRREPHLTHASW